MNKSFTLIEILVVIVVIGIISSFIIIGLSSVSDKAKIAKSQAFINSVDNSLLLSRVSNWKLDGNANDSWGVNNGTLVGPTHLPVLKTGSDCVSGSCYSFDGTEDYINCGNDETLKSLSRANQDSTWSMWFKAIVGGEMIGKYSPFQFRTYNSKLASYIYNGSSHLIGGPWEGNKNVLDNKWHNAVFIIDRDKNFLVYLDGSQDGLPVDISSHSSENWTESSNLYIGVRDPGAGFFNGLIDEVKIYNQTISVLNINQEYYSGINKLFKNYEFGLNEFNQRLTELKYNLSKNKNTLD